MKQSYEAEARERWGNTQAYIEHTDKTKGYTPDKWKEANDGLMNILAEFAAWKNSGFEPNSEEVQALVVKLQKHISDNYYTCTDEILSGLGQMYVNDERFKKNIDKYGDGTADYASRAIAAFCEVK